MFDSLTDRLGDVFDRLRRHGALSADDVAAALREIRLALLEADVALPVVRDFVAAVREKALGQEVLRSVTPAQMVVKIVHDHLIEVLGGTGDSAGENGAAGGLDLTAPAPVGIMLVGLQGSGKTTTAAKIANRLKGRERKKVLLASLDVQRPAAQEQLAVLGRQIGVASLPVVAGERPVAITRRALETGRAQGYDVVHARHRRPAPRQRGADARSGGGARGGQPAPDAARRRRDDRAGRGQPRQGVWRARRHHRDRPDPGRWRRPRRGGAGRCARSPASRSS